MPTPVHRPIEPGTGPLQRPSIIGSRLRRPLTDMAKGGAFPDGALGEGDPVGDVPVGLTAGRLISVVSSITGEADEARIAPRVVLLPAYVVSALKDAVLMAKAYVHVRPDAITEVALSAWLIMGVVHAVDALTCPRPRVIRAARPPGLTVAGVGRVTATHHKLRLGAVASDRPLTAVSGLVHGWPKVGVVPRRA